MNVLFLTSDYPPNLVGGVGTYTEQFARYLASRGHQAFVITRTEETPLEYVERGVRVWRVRPARLRWLDPVRDLLPEFVRRAEYSVAVARQLYHVLRRFRIDLVESCESRAEGFWYFLFHRNPKLLIKLHTPDGIIFELNQEAPSCDRTLLLWLEEWWLRRARILIGLTDALTQRVGKRYQLRTDHIPKVRVPVETRFFVPDPLARSWDRPQVLYVGRLEFRKGVHVLLRALPRLLEAIPNLQVTLIGKDCGMKPLVDAYRRLPRFQRHLCWRESVSREELRDAYQHSHVCVVPSLWDNHPAVCLEAMSCGCAVVASHVGGIPEMIQHGAHGLLVPVGSSQRLARAVIGLFDDARTCEALGTRARHHVEQRYAMERVFDETMAIYEPLCRTGHGHGAA
ncbi:MAG: glycosyltransferase family 4 protein [Elusimicrobia bacterium]|nr:glycosyltransferase family 4 protein [Elusimicrobiota bacterium]